jgi:hypothetical protein
MVVGRIEKLPSKSLLQRKNWEEGYKGLSDR